MEDDNLIAKLHQMWVYQKEIQKSVRVQVYFAARRNIKIYCELNENKYIKFMGLSAKLPVTLLLEKNRP